MINAPASLLDAVDVSGTPGVSLADLAEHWWTRTASQDPVIRAMVSEPDRLVRLRRQAAVLEERYPSRASRPPLFGAVVAVKDIFHVDGLLTRAGSRLPPDELTGEQGPAASRLLDAGALVLGKSATTEFAYFDPPPTRNPRDINRTPGGSSSGSAAAVAARYCPLALGSQTAGSVIRPAAFCGVVGTKPTYGRVPTDGVIALAPSFDTIGWFTSDVADARLAASVLCDEWRSGVERERPRIGVPVGPYLEQTEPEALDAFEAQLAALSGFEIERVPLLSDVELLNAHHLRLMQAEAAVVHEPWFDRFRELYRPALTTLIVRGREVGAGEADAIRGGRSSLRAALEAAMDEHAIDVWACPAAPGPAPVGLRSTGSAVMNIPWTHAGMPMVTVPSGTLHAMPLGLQLVARAGADEQLFEWAASVEQTLRPG